MAHVTESLRRCPAELSPDAHSSNLLIKTPFISFSPFLVPLATLLTVLPKTSSQINYLPKPTTLGLTLKELWTLECAKRQRREQRAVGAQGRGSEPSWEKTRHHLSGVWVGVVSAPVGRDASGGANKGTVLLKNTDLSRNCRQLSPEGLWAEKYLRHSQKVLWGPSHSKKEVVLSCPFHSKLQLQFLTVSPWYFEKAKHSAFRRNLNIETNIASHCL